MARTLLWDTTNFIDIMGMVKDVGSLETTSKGSKKLDVLLVDDKSKIYQEPWHSYLIMGAKGNSVYERLGSSSRRRGVCYHHRPPSKTIVSSRSLPPPPKKRFVSTEDNIIADTSIQTILDAQLPVDKKITVHVKDDTAKTTFTLFNKEAQRPIAVPIQTIIAEIGQVKVTIFNLDGRERYTVARLFEVTDQPPSTSDPPES
ncbi:hypothetical protein DCAR_0312999 [Daucus carota subsp. sativus]|uniref:Uncharacterized protein n=1 Tax=Daucus carota subsp. sativus TaxID=79200 RepID=A0A166BQB4_DAUCS|nr:hypothetical protein DCAR_0312999 [Daucus carota subsp. sativus]